MIVKGWGAKKYDTRRALDARDRWPGMVPKAILKRARETKAYLGVCVLTASETVGVFSVSLRVVCARMSLVVRCVSDSEGSHAAGQGYGVAV